MDQGDHRVDLQSECRDMLREPEDHLPVCSSDSIAPEGCKNTLIGIVDEKCSWDCGQNILFEQTISVFSLPKQLARLVKEIKN